MNPTPTGGLLRYLIFRNSELPQVTPGTTLVGVGYGGYKYLKGKLKP